MALIVTPSTNKKRIELPESRFDLSSFDFGDIEKESAFFGNIFGICENHH
jgi:hypothetical protein